MPVISVGNITAGGTGKTPMTIHLTKEAKARRFKPGIVSRGHGRDSQGLQVVHDGNRIITNVENSGDEPFLIASLLKNVPVVVSENRVEGAERLIQDYDVDLIILDDAFQHLKVKRNIDVVMISAFDKLSGYHLLPWGRLREPLQNLKRAQCVIYSNTTQFQSPSTHKIINPFLKNAPIASIMQPVLMKMDATGYHKALPTDDPIFVFCGIGNPDSFVQTVKECGLNIIGKRLFQDHQKYNSKVLRDLSIQVYNCNCKAIVTTEKDAVKIPYNFMKKITFYVIKIDLTFENDLEIINLIKSNFPSSP